MKQLVEDFKSNFYKPDNGLIQLILINVVVFVVMGIFSVFTEISGNGTVSQFLLSNIYLPGYFQNFLYKPWTIFTYFFAHAGPFHILFNMLALYWFGRLIHEYLGNRRLINIYILGGLFAGAFYLLLSNTIPYFIERVPIIGLVGASGSVIAIMMAAAVLLPDYSFYLIFIGPVKIKYIVGVLIFIYFLGIVGGNAGGNVAHLGGALMGYIYVRSLKRGRDLGQPINWLAKKIRSVRRPKHLKVSYRDTPSSEVSQKEIDIILDKISRSGYSSLSKEEKEKLYKASQK